jgi:hypothetical protein
MNNEDIKALAISLAMAETEKEVVQILTKVHFWNDESVWKEVDESTGNWSTIGNQQSAPDTALVEKIINSVDAVLTRECLRHGIKPDSDDAPKSIAEAQKEYFGIYNGKLSSVDASVRSKLAENIFLVATGEKDSPSYAIVDLGEGQSPKSFPNTFLSLNRGNKSKIQFVQGKFGMGGTGVFRFGSPEHNLQLIISKRDPEIKIGDQDDKWGVTIVRRIPPTGQMRSSIFTYLAPSGSVLAFSSGPLPLLPGDELEEYNKPLSHGTYIKIYEYQIGTGRLRSDATRHLHNRLSLLMPDIALPMRIADTRFKKSPIKMLSGLSVRLDEDKRENLEEGFPGSGDIILENQKMEYSIYAFKPGKRETYAGIEGIIFTVNGQVHGFLPRYFFERAQIKMGYIADSILVIVNCTKISRAMQEKLFMNSRDRLAGGALQDELEQQLEEVIKNHEGLKALRERRRREDVEHKLQDSKPLADVLENIIKKSPSLTSLFTQGVRIKNPFKYIDSTGMGKFRGKEFPTFFKLTKDYSNEKPKKCAINRKFRIQFETDAENDYFSRDKESGELTLSMGDTLIKDYTHNLWNGYATLTIALPQGVEIGERECFSASVIDPSKTEPFISEFCIEVDQPQLNGDGDDSDRKASAGRKNGSGRKPDYLAIPNVWKVKRDEWPKHGFNERSALKVVDGGDEAGFDFFINIDNVYLQMEMKENAKIEPNLLEARFTYGMVLIGISLLDFEEKKKKGEKVETDNKDDISIYERISSFTSALSPTLLPMITSLGDLES